MPNDLTNLPVTKTSDGPLPYSVYRILDPRNGLPFYVGQTENLDARKEAHKSLRVFSTAERIAAIQAHGLQPAFERIATARNRDNAVLRELMEVVRHVRAGYALTNPPGEVSRAEALIRLVTETEVAYVHPGKESV